MVVVVVVILVVAVVAVVAAVELAAVVAVVAGAAVAAVVTVVAGAAAAAAAAAVALASCERQVVRRYRGHLPTCSRRASTGDLPPTAPPVLLKRRARGRAKCETRRMMSVPRGCVDVPGPTDGTRALAMEPCRRNAAPRRRSNPAMELKFLLGWV